MTTSKGKLCPTKDKILLIDADSIVFGAGFAAEKRFYSLVVYNANKDTPDFYEFQYKKEVEEFVAEKGLGEDEYKLTSERRPEPVVNALALAKQMLNTVQERLQSYNVEVYLTGTDNFRYDVATIQPYKGNRKDAERPVHEKAIREYLIKHWNAKVVDGQEADDEVSIRQMQLWPNSVIVSADKDLDMVPGWHSKMRDAEPYYITWEEGMYNFYRQLLMGDPTDHIRGVPGIGKAKADKILDGLEYEEDMYAATFRTYKAYHLECLEQEGLDVDEEDVDRVVTEEIEENGILLWMRLSPGEMWQGPDMSEYEWDEE